MWEPPFVVDDCRAAVPHDYKDQLSAMLAEGRRGDMVEFFFTKAVDMPAQFVAPMRQIAENWLDWKKLGPIVEEYHALIAEDVEKDVHKLREHRGFAKSLTEDTTEETFRGARTRISLKTFADKRREFLLAHSEIKNAAIPAKSK